MNLKLTDKTALVSGSTKGIGFAIAIGLAREGARVIVNGRSEKGVAEAKAQVKQTVPDARIETFAGDLTQRTTLRGDETSASVLNGSVSGHRTDNTATFQVSFPGLVPNALVTLRLISPSSYAMKATTLGSTLMDVTFSRAVAR